ncbi:MAG: hypothetical protein AB7E79_13645 [Rhodospirillaceae bacterium]
MSRSDDINAKVKECLRKADVAGTDAERRSWLEIAEGYLRSITPTTEQTAAREKFDAEVKARETGQRASEREH